MQAYVKNGKWKELIWKLCNRVRPNVMIGALDLQRCADSSVEQRLRPACQTAAARIVQVLVRTKAAARGGMVTVDFDFNYDFFLFFL